MFGVSADHTVRSRGLAFTGRPRVVIWAMAHCVRTFSCILVAALTACQPARDDAQKQIASSASVKSIAPAGKFARGRAETLDIASWNIEWFGDPTNGPSNEPQQLRNARDVIAGVDADVWGLAEIVDESEFNQLKMQLPGYDGFLANARIVSNRRSSYGATEQKVGILFKRSVASLVGARVILSQNNRDFAGRPPLEVTLRVTLNGATEEVICIVLHMKATADEASWMRRSNASRALKRYLDDTYPTQRVIVMGDWNDDVNRSISIGKPSPYQNFVDDASHYHFVTKSLDDRGVSSTTGHRSLIDHHLVTNELAADEIPNSAEVIAADRMIKDFRRTTSDHFPVLSHYAVSAHGTRH